MKNYISALLFTVALVMPAAFASAQAISAAPIAASPSVQFSINLGTGTYKNPEVTRLQQFLSAQGVYSGPVTGNFLSLTMAAVKKFQAAHNIPATGFWGVLSRAAANEHGSGGGSVQSLSITTQDSLFGSVGQDFSIKFKAAGGAGTYDMTGSGNIPGLTFTRSVCPAGVQCIWAGEPDTVTLSGIPTSAGRYQITVSAQGSAVSPCTDTTKPCTLMPLLLHGSANFTIVVTGKTDTSAGTLTIDPIAQLRAGDEVIISAKYQPAMPPCVAGTMCAMVMPAPIPVVATWKSDVPTIAAIVPACADASGCTSMYVNALTEGTTAIHASYAASDGRVLSADAQIVVTGQLQVSPASATVSIGSPVSMTAMYQDPLPGCAKPTNPIRCMIATFPPHAVMAQWTIDDPAVASLATVCDAVTNSNACSSSHAVVTGKAPGLTMVHATYQTANGTFIAIGQIAVPPATP